MHTPDAIAVEAQDGLESETESPFADCGYPTDGGGVDSSVPGFIEHDRTREEVC